MLILRLWTTLVDHGAVDRRHPPLPVRQEAGRLPRHRPSSPAVRPEPRAARTDLQTRVLQLPARPRRSGLVSSQDPRAAPRVLSTRPRPTRRAGRDRRDRPQTRVPLLATTHHRTGLRVQTPPSTATPRARTPRRRADEARHPARQGHTHDQAADPSRTPTHRTSRTRLPTTDPGLASHRQQPKWCGRRTGARITKAVKRHSSAAGNSPRTCALARGHPHHPKPSHAERNPSTQPLTYMRRSFNYVVAVIGSSPPRATGLLSRNSAPSGGAGVRRVDRGRRSPAGGRRSAGRVRRRARSRTR